MLLLVSFLLCKFSDEVGQSFLLAVGYFDKICVTVILKFKPKNLTTLMVFAMIKHRGKAESDAADY